MRVVRPLWGFYVDCGRVAVPTAAKTLTQLFQRIFLPVSPFFLSFFSTCLCSLFSSPSVCDWPSVPESKTDRPEGRSRGQNRRRSVATLTGSENGALGRFFIGVHTARTGTNLSWGMHCFSTSAAQIRATTSLLNNKHVHCFNICCHSACNNQSLCNVSVLTTTEI